MALPAAVPARLCRCVGRQHNGRVLAFADFLTNSAPFVGEEATNHAVNAAKRRKQTEVRYRRNHRAIINAHNQARVAAKRGTTTINQPMGTTRSTSAARLHVEHSPAMNQNIINLSQVNHALAVASVNAAQLVELGFRPLGNKAICEGLPPEQARQLRSGKLYPADSVPRIRQALASQAGPACSASSTDHTHPGV